MPETTPLIKAALNLRVGVGFDVYDGIVDFLDYFSDFSFILKKMVVCYLTLRVEMQKWCYATGLKPMT